ncbi:hypothetical protein [Sphingomonas yantingensis]|uniref:Uncharacterized protein n=1 Tax=Sphingomonas yantingensis TaxID=1241761 RepID=A0A7W9EHX1_9SPHN|nr:hypothetical protein [Sphingomonas yantingensis]MBB5698504.1 hypothetical protein [Sphingomonas yantingensis]
MHQHNAAIAVMISLALSACTKPADVSRPLSEGADKNAKIEVKDTADGFTVDVRYSRYQFVPEAGPLLTACRSIATGRINEEAKRRGREILPLDEQQIRVSTGRNIVNARTSCRAFAEVRWK